MRGGQVETSGASRRTLDRIDETPVFLDFAESVLLPLPQPPAEPSRGIRRIKAVALTLDGPIRVQVDAGVYQIKHKTSGEILYEFAARSMEAARFDGMQLRGAAFGRCVLNRARFVGADLEGADFSRSTLANADFSDANLLRAVFQGATLLRAKLVKADLGSSNLRNASLFQADLSGANLEGADLQGADFDQAELAEAELGGAKYDRRTRWPEGVDPLERGAVLVSEN